MFRTLAILSALVLAPLVGRAADDTPQPHPAKLFQGTWIFDNAMLKKRTELGRVQQSVVTVTGDSFTLSKLMDCKGDVKGTLIFDPTHPGHVDLKIAELDLSEFLEGYKLPAGTLAGRYRFDGDRLTLCFPHAFAGKRPTEFVATAEQYLATLVRTPKDFKAFPKEVKVTVVGPDGKPAADALVCQHMMRRESEDQTKPAKWEYYEAMKCGADGTIILLTEKLRVGQVIACGAGKDTMGLVTLSPAKLATGALRIELRPQVQLSGKLVCEELTKAGQPIGWAGGYLLHEGSPVAFHASKEGKFEFLAPPGKYTLNIYGSAVDSRFVDITVPENRSEFTVEPIALEALAFALLKGRPAPELKGVVTWKGKPTTFADLKGKYTLVEFWGYWCGPCVGSMPILIELHEKYADKGLAIIGVHMDLDGEVDTSAKLDAKLTTVKKQLWKGKDLPFPSALVSGTRVGTGEDKRPGGAISQYGIRGFPTCLLIDREGKVVGEFHARDLKKASDEIEKLLADKK